MPLFFLKQGCDRTAGLAYRTGFMFTALEKAVSTHFANSIYYLSYSPTSRDEILISSLLYHDPRKSNRPRGELEEINSKNEARICIY